MMKPNLITKLRKKATRALQPAAPQAQYGTSDTVEPHWLGQTPPTIIFGNPRSGTRMCANVLQTHPKICVTEETLGLPRLLDTLKQIDTKFMGKFHDGTALQARREMLARALWIARSSDRVIRHMNKATHVANKTPRLEHRFEELETLFQVSPPRYVYCVRNAFGVLKSIKNLPNLGWHKNPVEENLEHYLASLRQYDKICAAAPDRIVMINLDEIKTAPSNFALYKPVFDLMGLPPASDKLQAKINNMGPQNTMQRVNQKTGHTASVQALTEAEVSLIATNTEYQAFAKRFGLATSLAPK